MIGRILLWVNGFVVPAAVAIYTLDWIGLVVAVVSFANTLYFDLIIRPKIEKTLKAVARLLKMWE